MRKSLLIIALVLSAAVGAQNIAYVQQDSILASLPSYKVNMEKIDAVGKKYQAEIKSAKDELTGKFQNLLKPYNPTEKDDIKTLKARMTAIDTTSLSIIQDEEKIVTKKATNYEALLKGQYQKDIQPMMDKVNKVLEAYAVKNKIDVIYIMEQIRPALAYIDKRKNITKQIITLLK